jgi:hypothetical protein
MPLRRARSLLQDPFELYSEMGDALLTHEGDGYDTYDQTLFYAVRAAAAQRALHTPPLRPAHTRQTLVRCAADPLRSCRCATGRHALQHSERLLLHLDGCHRI